MIFVRACLKNHSSNLHAPICGIFCLHSVDVARYAALIQAKSPANCDAHLAESIFQIRSKIDVKNTEFGTYAIEIIIRNVVMEQDCFAYVLN